MRHKLWLVIVILLLAAAGLFAFAATGHTYFAALLALIAALIVFHIRNPFRVVFFLQNLFPGFWGGFLILIFTRQAC